MRPANDDVLIAAMICEMAGGDCEFMIDPPKDMPNQIMPYMNPVFFGSKKCKVYETILHSYLEKGFAVDYGLSNCSHYLWGMRNTWSTYQHTLVFLINYDRYNGPIC